MGPKQRANFGASQKVSDEDAPKLTSKKLGAIAIFTAEDKIPVLVPPGGKNQPTNWNQYRDCVSVYCRRHCAYWRDFIELRKRPTIELPKHPRWRNMTQADIAGLADILAPEVIPGGAAEADDGEQPAVLQPPVQLPIDDDDGDGSEYGDEVDPLSTYNVIAASREAAAAVYGKREEDYRKRMFDLKTEGVHVHALMMAHVSQASQNCIISQKNYQKMSVERSDPLWLFEKLELTHWLSPSGHTVLDKFQIEDRFNKFVFREDEDVATCKDRWIRMKMQVDALGIPVRDEAEYVKLFICTKLPSSLAEYKKRFVDDSDTTNRANHPTSMEGLFERLKRELKVEKTSAGKLAVVPVMQSFAAQTTRAKAKGKKKSAATSGTGHEKAQSSTVTREGSTDGGGSAYAAKATPSVKKPSRPCTTCELLGKTEDTMHWTSDCPHKDEVKRLLKEAQKPKGNSPKLANYAHVCTAWYHSDDDYCVVDSVGAGVACVNVTMSERIDTDTVCLYDVTKTEFERVREALAFGQPTRLHTHDVVLDGGCQVGIFHNESLLTNVREVAPVDIKGVTGLQRVDRAGTFRGLTEPVYILKTAPANLLPQTVLEDERILDYDRGTRSFTVCHDGVDQHEPDWVFTRRDDLGGLRVCNFSPHSHVAMPASVAEPPELPLEEPANPSAWNAKTLEERFKALKPRDRKGAQIADEFMQRLGYESSKSTANIIRSGAILNAPCSTKNVYDSVRIHMGELEAGTKGKGRHEPDTVHVLEPSQYFVPSVVGLEADLFYVDKSVFLLTLSDYGYAMSTYIGQAVKETRLPSVIWEALPRHFSAYMSKGQSVKSLKADGEGCFGVNKEKLEERGISFIAGKALRAEERIKWIKNKDRSTKAGLPYPLFGGLIIMCVLAMVRLTNFIPSVGTPGGITPSEIFTGVRPDAKRDIPHSFGDYGLVTPPQSNPPAPYNSAAPRRISALYLFPDKVWSLRSQRTLTRVTFSRRAMPPEAIIYMHQLASASGEYRSRSQPLWRTPSGVLGSLPDDEEADELPQESLIPVHRPVADAGEFIDLPYKPTVDTLMRSDSAVEAQDSLMAGDADTVQLTAADLDEVAAEAAVEDDGEEDATTIAGVISDDDSAQLVPPLPDFIAPDVAEYVVPEERPTFVPEERRYPQRQGRTTWKERFSTSAGGKHAYHVKVKHALKSYRKAGLISMIKEMHSVGVVKQAIVPVDLKTYTKERRPKIIPSSFFFKEKFSRATGELIKLKGRLVAGGHIQDRELYSETEVSSPTVSTAAVFILASLAAKEHKHVWSCDVGTAYLNAKMPEDAPKQLMRLDQEVARVLVWLKPEYAEFLNDDGTMVVEITKALYGCIESAKLWYDELTEFLESLEFTKNPYEPCLFSKFLPDGERFDLLVYVDDLLMVCAVIIHLETFVERLTEKYKDVTVNKEKKQEYLGMVLNFSTLGEVSIEMNLYVENILRDYGIESSAATPAESFLFTLRPNSHPLDSERTASFHSGVMRLMFLAKRVRVDILTAVVYLASRVQSPTEDDWKKFIRVLKYLYGTKDLSLRLSPDSVLAVRAYIDASFAVHEDMRGHTGAVITLGCGTIFARSVKQKLVSKSSTEAELIALSDALGQVIWTRNLLEALGYQMEPATVLQDNLSTVAMINNGAPTSSRTRHIHIRFFFAKDRVDQREIKIEYCPTEDMWADLFTKPLQGALFVKLRDLVLGASH